MYRNLQALPIIRLGQMARAINTVPAFSRKEGYVFFSGHRHVRKDELSYLTFEI